MAKPIFIIRYPNEAHLGVVDSLPKLHEIFDDYHIFALLERDAETFTFECLNSDKTDEVKFKELQDRLLKLAEV